MKTGAGTLTLSGSNTYTGTTTIADGALSVASILANGDPPASNLGDSTEPIVLGSAATQGTLIYTGPTADWDGGVVLGPDGGSILVTRCGQTFTINTVTTGEGNGTTTSGSLTIGGIGSTTVEGAVDLGGGQLTKLDTGTLTLNGAGTMGGATVSGGHLLAGPGGLGTGTVTVNPDGSFTPADIGRLTAADIGGLEGDGTVDLAGGA